jgi:hypothetical protein
MTEHAHHGPRPDALEDKAMDEVDGEDVREDELKEFD